MIKVLFLGFVQGITEFLPISSSAHLAFLEQFMHLPYDPISLLFLDVMLHCATTLAVICFFFKDWIYIIFKRKDLLFTIIIANIPAGVLAVLLSKMNLLTTLRHPLLLVAFLMFGNALMQWAEDTYSKFNNLSKKYLKDDVSFWDGITIGLFQAFALFPGVSRSGASVSAGFGLGLQRYVALQFSFLLATPLILLGTVFEVYDYVKSYPDVLYVTAPNFVPPLLILASAIIAFVTGLFVIKYLLQYLTNNRFDIFIRYRIWFALFILGYYIFTLF